MNSGRHVSGYGGCIIRLLVPYAWLLPSLLSLSTKNHFRNGIYYQAQGYGFGNSIFARTSSSQYRLLTTSLCLYSSLIVASASTSRSLSVVQGLLLPVLLLLLIQNSRESCNARDNSLSQTSFFSTNRNLDSKTTLRKRHFHQTSNTTSLD